jgi:hypothetical protein
MKKYLLGFLLLTGFTVKSQHLFVKTGFNANFTPTTSPGGEITAGYRTKNGDAVAYTVFENNWRAYYCPHYSTALNDRTSFTAGMAFINDYTPGQERVLSQSAFLGVQYDFKKVRPDDIFNFYGGFFYTNNRIFLRMGFALNYDRKGVEPRRKRKHN